MVHRFAMQRSGSIAPPVVEASTDMSQINALVIRQLLHHVSFDL